MASAETEDQPRKKRKYSRNGCKECKRRKLKCDEGKPKCWNCSHLNKDCTYEKNIKFKNSRSFTIQNNGDSNERLLIDLNTKEKMQKDIQQPKQPSLSIPIFNTGKTAVTDIHNFSKTSPTSSASSKPGEDVFIQQAPMIVQNPSTPLFSGVTPGPQTGGILTMPTIQEQSMTEGRPRKHIPVESPSTMVRTRQQSIELDNNLFTGASNLILDLNDLIHNFGADFPSPFAQNVPGQQIPFDTPTQLMQHQHQHNVSNQLDINGSPHHMMMLQEGSTQANQQQHLRPDQQFPNQHISLVPQQKGAMQYFEGISPTNYSVESNETPMSMEESHQQHYNSDVGSSNDDYIKRLTKSLKTDFAASPPTQQLQQLQQPQQQLQQHHQHQNQPARPVSPDQRYYMQRQMNNSGSSVLTPESRNLSLGNRPNNDAPPNNDFEQVQSAFPPPPPFIMMEESKERFEYLYSMNKSISQADLINLAQFFQWSVSSSHISYLKIFITKVHMNALPFTTSFLHSSFIRCFLLQAKSSAHLLFALLAIAARYESYQVNRLPEKDESVRKKLKFHNRMRSYYLSSCLKSLDAILHSKPKILNNIESLLLTILILASDYSGSTGSQWRAHLRGAKDLLIKYCTFKPTSLELAIIWIWFYSMETLAGLTVPSGGTIHEFDELIEFLDYVKSTGRIGNTLNRFGFLQAGSYDNELFSRDGIPEDDNDPRSTRYHTSFNLYLGYNDDIIDTFKEIVLALEASRWFSNKEKASPGSTFKNPSATQSPDDLPLINEILNDQGQVRNTHILKITMMIERSRSFKIINNKPPYRIPIDSLYHPLNLRGYHYNNPTGANIVMSNYIHNTNPQTCSLNDFENWYSWADLSQQLYADAALLKLLTMKHCYGKNGLSIQNGLVQDVVDRMILGLVSLIQLKNNISSSDLKELDAYYNETNVSTPTDAVSVTTELIAENIKVVKTEETPLTEVVVSRTEDEQMLHTDAGVVSDVQLSPEIISAKGKNTETKKGVSSKEEDEQIRKHTDNEVKEKENDDEEEEESEGGEDEEEGEGDDDGDDDDESDSDELDADLKKKKNIKIDEESNMNSISTTSANTNLSTIDFDKYLFYQFDNRLVMIQWPLFVCGLCSIQSRQKLIIDCCFNALMNLGVGSGEISLMKLKNLWTLEKSPDFDYANYDIFGDSNDSVPFT